MYLPHGANIPHLTSSANLIESKITLLNWNVFMNMHNIKTCIKKISTKLKGYSDLWKTQKLLSPHGPVSNQWNDHLGYAQNKREPFCHKYYYTVPYSSCNRHCANQPLYSSSPGLPNCGSNDSGLVLWYQNKIWKEHPTPKPQYHHTHTCARSHCRRVSSHVSLALTNQSQMNFWNVSKRNGIQMKCISINLVKENKYSTWKLNVPMSEKTSMENMDVDFLELTRPTIVFFLFQLTSVIFHALQSKMKRKKYNGQYSDA